MNYYLSTKHDSAIKSISSKPLWVTTRDASIITAATLVATLILTWVWYVYTKTSSKDRDYWSVTWQTILTSMAAQYFYEYLGINNMLAESSIRYAKGSSLAKYVNRRSAVLYECLYRLLSSEKYKSDKNLIKKNFKILKIMTTKPLLVGKMIDYVHGNITKERLYEKFPKDIKSVDILLRLENKTLLALETVADRINAAIMYDILINGLSDYELEDTIVLSEIKNMDKLRLRGEKIKDDLVDDN